MSGASSGRTSTTLAGLRVLGGSGSNGSCAAHPETRTIVSKRRETRRRGVKAKLLDYAVVKFTTT